MAVGSACPESTCRTLQGRAKAPFICLLCFFWGHVRWFDKDKGFGKILPRAEVPQTLSCLTPSADGALMRCTGTSAAKGWTALRPLEARAGQDAPEDFSMKGMAIGGRGTCLIL